MTGEAWAHWLLVISLIFTSLGNMLLVGKMSQLVGEYELASETVNQLRSARQAEIQAMLKRAEDFTAKSSARHNNIDDSDQTNDNKSKGELSGSNESITKID